MSDLPPISLVEANNEKKPYSFGAAAVVERRFLKTGDYSIAGFEEHFTVERKSLSDLFGTVVRERDRFERQLQRMSLMERACIVVEATAPEVWAYDSPESTEITEAQRKSRPATVMHSLQAWYIAYGIPFFFLGADRDLCARFVLRLAQKFAAKMASKTAGAA